MLVCRPAAPILVGLHALAIARIEILLIAARTEGNLTSAVAGLGSPYRKPSREAVLIWDGREIPMRVFAAAN
jgi:hypothetical protein